MRMCMVHWNALRAAIDSRGLGVLVSDDGAKAASNMVSEMADGPTVDNFDPLMGAHNAIVSNVLRLVGLEVMRDNEDGSARCPLCFINASHAAGCHDPKCTVVSFDHWIDHAADDMVTRWKRLAS